MKIYAALIKKCSLFRRWRGKLMDQNVITSGGGKSCIANRK